MRILRIKALENLVIKDKDKKTIYLAPAGKVFNLPIIGRVYIKGKYKRLPSKIITNVKLKYYKPEKNIDFKGIQRIVFSKNPNKCSIDVYSGTLIFDSDFFKKLNIAQLYFILSHELGHYFYYTEHKCDAFARAIMLLLGFNPSQIIASANSTLIDEFRKNENLAQLLKNK
jgi:hypothetical protein